MTSANIGNTMSNVFNPMNDLPSSNTLNRTFLIGTAGIQAAGGPAPDYFVPNGFLFSAGGSITSNFAQNGGAFTALPIDGTMSRIWNGGNNVINSPMNFAGQSGVVVGVPEPTTMILINKGLEPVEWTTPPDDFLKGLNTQWQAHGHKKRGHRLSPFFMPFYVMILYRIDKIGRPINFL